MNNCYKHSNREAIRKCSKCGVDLCELCIELKEGQVVCYECKNKYENTVNFELVFNDIEDNIFNELETAKREVKDSLKDFRSENQNHNTNHNTTNTTNTTNNNTSEFEKNKRGGQDMNKTYTNIPRKKHIRKINHFNCFISSLFPGAGQMYLGLMSRGLLVMFSFIFLLYIINMPSLAFCLYIFSFYDTHNIKNKLLVGEDVEDNIDDLKLF